MPAKKYASETEGRRERYRVGRLALISRMGGACVDCGDDDASALEFDHIEPRTWTARDTSRLMRLARYKREASAGLIELRCRTCNKKKGRPVDLVADAIRKAAEEPLPQ